MKYTKVSIAKGPAPNEDAVLATVGCIAVSDGAGGCGVYADQWSRYLLDHLDTTTAMTDFESLDDWVDGIWEPFYDAHEIKAKEQDGLFLDKFYKEGSCATLAVAWVEGIQCRWMAYGDSVVFHYNQRTGCLGHSFLRLTDFSEPPYLISSKDPLEKDGFRSGLWMLEPGSIIFVASDALSHYILMMYELTHADCFQNELDEERRKPTQNAVLLRSAETLNLRCFEDIFTLLIEAAKDDNTFKIYMNSLKKQGLLDTDDYSLAVLYDCSNNQNEK